MEMKEQTPEEFYEYGFYDKDLYQVIRIQGEPKGIGPSYRRRLLRVIGEWESLQGDSCA